MKEALNGFKDATGQASLIGYMPALYPDTDRYHQILGIGAEEGLRFMEIGLPCRDPYLDGTVIREALKAVEARRPDFPGLIQAAGRSIERSGLKGIAMVYNERLEECGIDVFVDQCLKAGIHAVLVPNIIDRNRLLLYEQTTGTGIETVSFLSFNHNEKQIESILAQTTGFLYMQSTKGSTGGQFVPGEESRKKLGRIKDMAFEYRLPVALGFGINTPADAANAAEIGADAVIIGTAFVKAVQSGGEAFRRYLKGFSAFLKKEALCKL